MNHSTDTRMLRAWLPLAAVALAALVLAERMFLLVERYAVNIFFSDQWEFNDATVFQQHSLWQIFTWQHGPHRQGLGGVMAALLEPRFQWDSRTESYLIAGIFVAAALLAVWLKFRLYGKFEYYDIAIPSLVLTATQCEVIFGAANLAHGSLPLLLVIVYGLSWTIRRTDLRFAVILIVNFLLIFTGFGLLMGAITPLVLLASWWRSPRERSETLSHLVAGAIALASLGAFFVHYTWNPAVSCYNNVSRNPADYLRFASLMVANYLGFDQLGSQHPALWGTLLLAFLVALFATMVIGILAWKRAQDENSAAIIVPLALLAFSLAFCAATVRGRLCLGMAAAQESRYMPYLTPGFLGSYFFLCGIPIARWTRHAVLTAFLLACAYATWPLHVGDQLELSRFHTIKLQWKSCYLATRNAAWCDRQTGIGVCNPPERIHLQEKLDALEKQHLNLFNGR